MFTLKEFVNRLKNRGTLVMFLSMVFGILVNLGLVDVELVHQYQGLINAILGIVAGFGVVRDPYGEKRK